MILLRALLLSLLLLLVAPTARAQEVSPEMRADIVELLEITGSMDLGLQMGEGMLEALTDHTRAVRPDVSDEELQQLHVAVMEVMTDDQDVLVDLLVPIYARYYTHEDVKGLIAFYQSDLGQKTIQVSPALLRDSMAAGEQWGVSLGPKIEAKMMETVFNQGKVK